MLEVPEIPLVRSTKILRHAKGQPCTLRFPGICNGNPETTVACHIRDRHKGMGQKASDYSVVFGCSDCHRYLDEHVCADADELLEMTAHIVRGLQETWGVLIRDGIIVVPQDANKPSKPVQRKPKGQRKPIANRGFDKSKTRRMNGTVVDRESGEKIDG